MHSFSKRQYKIGRLQQLEDGQRSSSSKSLLDENVKSIILGVLNEAEDAINTVVDTVLEMELNPIKGDCNKDFMIDWGEYKDGYKVKYPVKSWDKTFQ